MVGIIGSIEGPSGRWVVLGMLKRREELSGLSIDRDLNDDEDDEGMFGSVGSGRLS